MALNLRKLISISTQLSLEACRIIHQSLTTHSYRQFLKGEDDSVTDTDFKVQSMLMHGFRMHFPNLKIIGEESEQFKGSIDYNYSQLNLDILPNSSKIVQNIQLDKSCLWIDPIDCTRGFLNGNYEDITVLIGLSYNKLPVAGIIGTPFKLMGQNKVYEPVVTIGSVKQYQAFDFAGKKWVQKSKKYPINNPLKIATSNSRQSKSETRLLRQLKATNVQAGGSGRKIIMVANGEVDAMAFCENWTHKWDSCAGDAIIKAMGGRFTTPLGNNIIYNGDCTATFNKQGIVASLYHEVHQKCINAMSTF